VLATEAVTDIDVVALLEQRGLEWLAHSSSVVKNSAAPSDCDRPRCIGVVAAVVVKKEHQQYGWAVASSVGVMADTRTHHCCSAFF